MEDDLAKDLSQESDGEEINIGLSDSTVIEADSIASDFNYNIYNSEEAKSFPFENNDIVVFRHRIYRITQLYSLWRLYDYFGSVEIQQYHESDYNFAIEAYIDTRKKEIDSSCGSDKLKGITYNIFVSGARRIEKEDVPSELIRCMREIQQLKVMKAIPMAVIKQHEDFHEERMKENIARFVNIFMKNILTHIECQKEVISTIDVAFTMTESNLTENSAKKILYKYPGMDGVVRESYKDYFAYIFQKIYPMPDVLCTTPHGWTQIKFYELLRERYPFLDLSMEGGEIKLKLPTDGLLR